MINYLAELGKLVYSTTLLSIGELIFRTVEVMPQCLATSMQDVGSDGGVCILAIQHKTRSILTLYRECRS